MGAGNPRTPVPTIQQYQPQEGTSPLSRNYGYHLQELVADVTGMTAEQQLLGVLTPHQADRETFRELGRMPRALSSETC